MEVHARDELAKLGADLFPFIPFHHLVQPGGQSGVGLRCGGVHRDLGRLLEASELALKLGVAGRVLDLQRLELINGHGLVEAELLGPLEAAADLGQLPLDRRAARQDLAPLGGGGLAMAADRLGDGLGRQEPRTDAFDHALLDGLGGDDLAVATRAALAMGAARILGAV